ncbi:MAG: hypothetical protein ACRBDL_00760 [Alphaproteobacteria bacterium]
MGKIKDQLNERKESEANQSLDYERAVKASKADTLDQHASSIITKKHALAEIKEDLAPDFHELRKNPRTMFLLPSLRPLKMGTTKTYLKTKYPDSVQVNEPVLICNLGICNSKPQNPENKERIVISYDADKTTYNIQEQEYGEPPGSNPNVYDPDPGKSEWHKVGKPTADLSKKEALEYMESRLVAALENHEKATPRRITKFAIAATVALGISQCAGNSNAETIDNIDNLNTKDAHTEQVDIPNNEPSSLDL